MTNIGRHTFRLDREERRPVLHAWVDKMPVGAVLEFRDATRTEEQNDALHPRLREVAKQFPISGRHMSEEWWKNVFLVMLGREVELAPAPPGTGGGLIPCVRGSSKLTIKEFGELLDLIDAWAAENGVELNNG